MIVVTGTRTPRYLAEIPQAMSVIGGEELRRQQARTPNLMLADMPGVWSVNVSTQGSPIIRGLMGNRVVYLWDGVRLNNGALFSGPNGFFNQFPVGSVERMEVLRGPGAVQYGSDAIGGVINVIGKQSTPFAGPRGASGDAGARYDSVDGETTLYGDVSVVGDSVGLAIGVSGQHVGHYHGPGVGAIANTGFDNRGGHAGFGWKLDSRQTVRASLVADERSDVETYAQSKLNASGVPRIFGPFERRSIAKIDYDGVALGSASQSLKAYAYTQGYKASRVNTNETASAVSATTALTDQRVNGLGVQNSTALGAWTVTAGADARFERLASSRLLSTLTKATGNTVVTVPNGQVPDGRYDVLDAFALGEWALARDLTLTLGARFEQVHLKSDPAPKDALAPFTVDDLRLDRRWNAPTYSLGMLYRLTKEWSLAAHAATGFRAPTYSDTLSTSVPVFATGIASVPSPNVQPEHSRSFEVSARWSAAAGWGTATAYRTDLKDLVVSKAVGTITIPGVGLVTAQQSINSGRGLIDGVELDGGWVVTPGWTLFGNMTYTHGVDKAASVPLRFIPPLNGRVGLRTGETKRWWVEGALRWAARMRKHAPQDELDAGFSTDPGLGSPNMTTNPPYRPGFEIPGFAVVSLRGGMSVTAGALPVELMLALNNLLNAKYREAYSQQQLVGPGFGAVLGASVAF